MTLNDYAKEIAKDANVNTAQARRVMQALFGDIKRRLDSEQNVTLPTLGRLINQERPNGRRVILSRPKAAATAKAKPVARRAQAAKTKPPVRAGQAAKPKAKTPGKKAVKTK